LAIHASAAALVAAVAVVVAGVVLEDVVVRETGVVPATGIDAAGSEAPGSVWPIVVESVAGGTGGAVDRGSVNVVVVAAMAVTAGPSVNTPDASPADGAGDVAVEDELEQALTIAHAETASDTSRDPVRRLISSAAIFWRSNR